MIENCYFEHHHYFYTHLHLAHSQLCTLKYKPVHILTETNSKSTELETELAFSW